jgi:hypothetical protein
MSTALRFSGTRNPPIFAPARRGGSGRSMFAFDLGKDVGLFSARVIRRRSE